MGLILRRKCLNNKNDIITLALKRVDNSCLGAEMKLFTKNILLLRTNIVENAIRKFKSSC